MSINQFRFFNKQGNSIQPKFNGNFFEFNLSFDRVSTDLFEVQQLYILEEVLQKNKNIQFTAADQQLEQPENLLINVLNYLKFYDNIESKRTYDEVCLLFNRIVDTEDNIDNFLISNNTYIDKYYSFSDAMVKTVYYNITYSGEAYLKEYTQNIEKRQLTYQNYVSKLARPFANYDTAKDELVYLYFHWMDEDDPEVANKIFPFLIDQQNLSYYERDGKKQSCIDTPKPFLNFVPLYDDFLSIDDNNPFWQYIFPLYDLQPTSNPTTVSGSNETRMFDDPAEEISQDPLVLNFAITSDTEGLFQRKLEVFIIKRSQIETEGTIDWISNSYKFAEINFQAEVIGENTGLKTILENFGRRIDTEDFYILKDIDVEEDNPNWIKINEKRKELILLSDEIYQYFGSYRSFRAALDWIGYSNIRLKEYFYNIKKTNPEAKQIYYSTIEVPDTIDYSSTQSFNEQKFGKIVQDPDWRKTSRFGLIFDLMQWSGEYDSDGFPILETTSQFTPEEISIKLFGMREFLHKYFTAHHVRIVDITAEGIYFAKYNLNVWNEQTPIIRLDFDNTINFTGYPRKGELKNLRKLLNEYQHDLNKDLTFEKTFKELVANNKTIADFKSNILAEFSDSYQLDFPFDAELDFETIKEKIPVYQQAYNVITDCIVNTNICHHRSAENYFDWSADVSSFKNQKLFGHPVKLVIYYKELTLNDLTLTWDEAQPYIVQNKLTYDIEKNPVLDGTRESGFNDGESDAFTITNPILEHRVELFSERVAELDYPKSGTLDDITNKSQQEVTWLIRHNDPSIDFCYKITGTFEKLKTIILFLPYVGFYDVKLTFIDRNNFPNVTYKEKYIEVVSVQDDIIAFGQFVVDDPVYMEETKIDDWTGTLDTVKYCPLVSEIDDLHISLDELNYIYYAEQEFANIGNKTTEIITVGKNEIYVEGKSFYNDWIENKDKWFRDVVVVARDSKDVYNAEFVEVVKSDSYNVFDIQTNYIPKIGEHVSIYEDHIFTDFSIDDTNKCIILNLNSPDFQNQFEKFPDNVIPGMNIFLYEEFYQREKRFIITELVKDYINNIIKIYINDDGSLSFLPIEHNNITNLTTVETLYDENGYEYNRSKWRIIRIKEKLVETRVKEVTIIEDYPEPTERQFDKFRTTRPLNQIRRIKVEPVYHLALVEQAKLNDLKYKADFGIHSGWFVCPLSQTNGFDVEYNFEYLPDSNQTKIKIYQNEIMNKIDTNWKIIWNPEYDLDWALQSTKVDSITIDSLEGLTIDDLYHQTSDMLDYRNDTIFGFELTNIENMGTSYLELDNLIVTKPATIIINDERFEFHLDRFPVEQLLDIDAPELITDQEKEWKYSQFTTILNSLQNGPLSNFDYIQNGVSSIVAIAKNFGERVFFDLKYELISGSSTTYPMDHHWSFFEKYSFSGPNHPADWNRFALGAKELTGGITPENIDRFQLQHSGSFTIADTFIQSKNFQVPKGTTVFFVYTNKQYDDDLIKQKYENGSLMLIEEETMNSQDIRFVWTLTDEITKKQLLKTTNKHIDWMFKEQSYYSIKLEIISKTFNKTIEKKSFIQVY